jgi:hypothetical protein
MTRADDDTRVAGGARSGARLCPRDEGVERQAVDEKPVLDVPGARRQRGSAADDLIGDEFDVAARVKRQCLLAQVDSNALSRP